jgi:hypothetical protein
LDEFQFFDVIASAAKQSIFLETGTAAKMDCFAALAMTLSLQWIIAKVSVFR